jgi:small-conductance mechanosensitive channel
MNDKSLELLKESWSVLRYTLFEVSGHKISFLSLLSAVGIFYITSLLSRWAERGIGRLLADRKDIDSGTKD